MRDHSKHIQVNKDTAVRMILEHCRFSPRQETVSLEAAIGRITAQDVVAKWNAPNTRSSKMDSVAVHWADFEQGMPDTSAWKRGVDWQFANTGVAMPEGFDTAIVVEHVVLSENDTRIRFNALPSGQYAGTSAVGSKLQEGAVMIPKGTVITPLLAAYAASGNNTELSVLKKPRVAFLPTGNELVPLTGSVPKGKNIESNSLMVGGKIRQWGGEPIIFDIIPDQKEALKEALQRACEEADIVVLNAGSSKGDDDWGVEMLEELGTVFYHQTNHGPGHHSSFGCIGTTPVIGISGPPGGAAFTTDYYLYPAMMAYLGKNPGLKTLWARLAQPLSAHGKKTAAPKRLMGEERPKETGEFYSVRQMGLVQAEDGVLEAFPVGGSHPKPTEAETAFGYYLMPSWEGEAPPQVGDMIKIELRPEFFGFYA